MTEIEWTPEMEAAYQRMDSLRLPHADMGWAQAPPAAGDHR